MMADARTALLFGAPGAAAQLAIPLYGYPLARCRLRAASLEARWNPAAAAPGRLPGG